jgi:hypothetical protein
MTTAHAALAAQLTAAVHQSQSTSTVIALDVPDLDDALDQLQALGWQVGYADDGEGIRDAWGYTPATPPDHQDWRLRLRRVDPAPLTCRVRLLEDRGGLYNASPDIAPDLFADRIAEVDPATAADHFREQGYIPCPEFRGWGIVLRGPLGGLLSITPLET